jgi:hypothetical protein
MWRLGYRRFDSSPSIVADSAVLWGDVDSLWTGKPRSAVPLLLHRHQSPQLGLRVVHGVFRYPTLLRDLPGLFPCLTIEVDSVGHRGASRGFVKWCEADCTPQTHTHPLKEALNRDVQRLGGCVCVSADESNTRRLVWNLPDMA